MAKNLLSVSSLLKKTIPISLNLTKSHTIDKILFFFFFLLLLFFFFFFFLLFFVFLVFLVRVFYFSFSLFLCVWYNVPWTVFLSFWNDEETSVDTFTPDHICPKISITPFNYLLMCLKPAWMHSKKCRPWSEAIFCVTQSRSRPSAQSCPSQYLGWIRYKCKGNFFLSLNSYMDNKVTYYLLIPPDEALFPVYQELLMSTQDMFSWRN